MAGVDLDDTSIYDSDSDTVVSERDDHSAFDHSQAHEHRLKDENERKVNIILRDAHDATSPGMTIEMPWLQTFKVLFDHFKARSCTVCRSPDEMRFKTKTETISEKDTPKELELLHGTTTDIKVWSSVPGLQCKRCKETGYPKTEGVDTELHKSLAPPLPTVTKPETLALLVHDQTGFEMSVKMLSTNPLKYLMETYATQAARDCSMCRFLFDGERMGKKETPKKLDMINGDRVEVYFEQIGG